MAQGAGVTGVMRGGGGGGAQRWCAMRRLEQAAIGVLQPPAFVAPTAACRVVCRECMHAAQASSLAWVLQRKAGVGVAVKAGSGLVA